MSNTENVRGPGKGFLSVIAVLVLTAGTWLGLWELHKHLYTSPRDPLSPIQSNANSN